MKPTVSNHLVITLIQSILATGYMYFQWEAFHFSLTHFYY